MRSGVTCLLVLAIAVVTAILTVPTIIRTLEKERHEAERLPTAELQWKAEFGDPAETLAARPKREDSDSAKALIELSRSVGIDLARPVRRESEGPGPKEDFDLLRSISDYGTLELQREGGRVGAPPAALRTYLAAYEGHLNAIVQFLLDAPALEWESAASTGLDAPLPNLRAHIHLQRLLVATALCRAHEGDGRGAERVLEASWVLNASLRERADVMSQLIAIAVARMQFGLVRRLTVDPVTWLGRVAEHDYRSTLLQALVVESLGILVSIRRRSWIGSRAARVDFLEARRKFLVDLRDSAVSDGPIGVVHPSLRNTAYAGVVAQLIEPTALATSIRRADRLTVDAELTERILQARLLKARLGHWPAEISDPTSRLRDARWIYAASPDGRLAIALSRELQWEGQSGVYLPLCFHSP